MLRGEPHGDMKANLHIKLYTKREFWLEFSKKIWYCVGEKEKLIPELYF